MQIRSLRLRPYAFLHRKSKLALAQAFDYRPPFAVTAIEYKHGVACPQPQHVLQVIHLRIVQEHAGPFAERYIDKKPRRTKVVVGHGRGFPPGMALMV